MHQERRIQILPVERLGHPCQKHYRKLQPLGLVDGHNPDAAGFLAGSSSYPQVAAVFSQPVNEYQEAEQPARIGVILKLDSPVIQRCKIILALKAARQAADPFQIAAFSVNTPNQCTKAALAGGSSPALEQLQKSLKLLLKLHRNLRLNRFSGHIVR
ncbi:hypothetical protein D3C75_602230 [compost metagenome]